MGKATVIGGLLGSLVLGVWIGCAGSIDDSPDLAAMTDGGGDSPVADAHDAADAYMLPFHCTNRDKDPGETDFDCGGTVPPAHWAKAAPSWPTARRVPA